MQYYYGHSFSNADSASHSPRSGSHPDCVVFQEGFQCIIEIEGKRKLVMARKQDDVIICSESSYSYDAEEPEIEGLLTVLWNGDIFVDKTNRKSNPYCFEKHQLQDFSDATKPKT